jgi:Tol biopolymer transport system component
VEDQPLSDWPVNDLEFEPSFSKDGKTLVYVTWNDQNMGAIYRLDMLTNAKPIKLTAEKAIYREPSFSPLDINNIVYRKESGNGHQGFVNTKEPGIYTLKTQYAKKTGYQSTSKIVLKEGSNPSFATQAEFTIRMEGICLVRLPKH